jgi:D-alanyl-D-alanine carboxypeptidase
MARIQDFTICFLSILLILSACSDDNQRTESNLVNHKHKRVALEEKPTANPDISKTPSLSLQTKASLTKEVIHVVAEPDTIPVLINKQNKLPDSYTPKDLVITNIPFIVTNELERTKMRKEAAAAVVKLFAKAKSQGLPLLGVSAYRSHITQTALFNYYVNRDGVEKARTYSAIPGTSEHETGLSIDVTGGDGKCAAQDCFVHTKEAKWLEEHAADCGFIIRYPKGKELITGYQYEPWHLRYVGKKLAKEIFNREITLEEYYGVVSVHKNR